MNHDHSVLYTWLLTGLAFISLHFATIISVAAGLASLTLSIIRIYEYYKSKHGKSS